jgi:ABC-type uncharacterized transport system substrate-binding protein
VSSLNRPGGNLTGVGVNTSALMPKRVELLLELIPTASKIALLQNRESDGADAGQYDVEAALRALGRQMIPFRIRSLSDLETAFVSAVRTLKRSSSVLVQFSRTGALKSWGLQHVMRCPRLTLGANLLRLVGWQVMAPT